MIPELNTKSMTKDIGAGSMKIIYPKEVLVTEEFESKSLLTLGRYIVFVHF